MKHLKKMLALVMAICLVLGLTPGSALAAEADTTEHLFFATDRHTNTSIIGNIINNIESDIGENELDYLGLGGDMVGSGNSHPAYNSSTVLAEATGATSSLSADNVDIVAGIHDMNVTDDAGVVLPYQGGGAQIYEGKNYYVYGVEEYCISDDSNETNWKTEAEKFVTWATSTGVDQSKAIFVLSHYPLHAKRDDNDGAYYWHQALNTVATGSATGTTVVRDVAFFHGHNHTVDSNEYVYNVGDTMSIQNGSSTTSGTIYYTYATAGYLNQNSKATLVTIDGSSITFKKYSTSGSGTVLTTVDRVVSKSLAGIAVTSEPTKTTYNVGDTFDSTGLTVTASYDDGTTALVTGYTLSEVDMSTSGTKTVTVTYEEKTATFNIIVNPTINTVTAETTYKNDDGTYTNQGNDVIATGLGLTDVSAVFNEIDLSDTYGEATTDYYTYDVALSGYEGEDVAIEFNAYNVDLTGAIVNLVNADGSVTKISGIVTCETTEDDVTYTNVSFTVPADAITDGAFTVSFGVQEIVIPEGYTLSDLAITGNPLVTKYFVDEDFVLGSSEEDIPLDITGLEVTATYTNGTDSIDKVLLWNAFDSQKDAYALNFDMANIGTQDVEISYTYEGVQKTTSYEITICHEEYADTTTDVKVVFETPEVIDVVITKNDDDESVASSLEYLLENYVSYDFELDGYTEGNEVTVTLPVPADVEKVGVFHVSDAGKATRVKDIEVNTDGTVTFVATAFSKYVVGEDVEIEVPDSETATGSKTTTTTTTKTVYVLTNSISSGNDYLIANSATAGAVNLVANDGGDLSNTSSTVIYGDADGDGDSEYYIELTDATNELWTVAGSYTFENQDEYLRCNNGNLSVSSKSTTWSYSSNRLSYKGKNNTYYLRYNDGWTVTSSSDNASSIYFYVSTEIEVETETPVSGTYSIDGSNLSVAVSSDSTANLTSTLSFETESGDVTTEDVSTTATYEVVTVDANGNTVDGDPKDIISEIENGEVTFTGNYGKALVKVSYTTDFGVVTDYITIEAKAPYYTIELHYATLTEVDITKFEDNVVYYTFNSTTNTYDVATEYVEGTTYYTTPVKQGDEIEEVIALKGIEKDDTYAVWAVVMEHNSANPDGVDMGTLGEALHWSVSDESIATIDPETGVIKFTGNNYGTFNVTVSYTGADGIVITDTITISATESLYVVPGDGTNDFPEYPNEGAVRFDKTATAVGNFSETGIAKVELSMTGVPYSTGSEIDVVLMLDMTGSMSDEAMVAAEEAAVAFVAQIVKNEDGTYNDNRVAVYAFNSSSSSPFELIDLGTIDSDTELEAANTAIRTASEEQVSGGTPYDEALAKCQTVLTEAKTTNLPEGVESAADYDRQQFCVFMSDGGPTSYEYITNYDEVKDGEATAYEHSSASATGGSNQSDSNFATIATYTHEYYSTLMKDDGVTMFSVLTGLSATDYPNCATILENIASSEDNAYVVESGDDTSAVSSALTSIAQKIVEAAKDIVVEDKIGSNYSVNFSVPGYGTDNAVSADALDGTTEFYIQVVEYQLNADKERTGNPAVLENFTFNAAGTLKSHTVDGVACSNCTHITTTGGVITAIDGTYFEYSSDSTGEYLTWKADKLTTTELALQYFAYLDNSAGVDADDQVDPGTYYTNEYATLTYTNYNGKQVQQEFPVPQMTWYGAQVSYVFYLVNGDGKPVNRAGRVVPFAEAVYVTDVNTYSIVWNDLEQSAGLEAERLADELVPDVYALYDDDASYNIHVYADEDGTNLNNHFVIGGDVTDDYNTTTNSWTNAKTTYVFNTKADAVKYNAVGSYIANDGSDTTKTTNYYCKSAYIANATYTTSVDEAGVIVYTVTDVGDGYQNVDGETQVAYDKLPTKTGATEIGGYAYYVDENGVYTIVEKTNGTEVRAGFDFANTTVAFAVVWKPELVEDTVVVDYGLDVVIDVATNDALASGVVGVRDNKPEGIEINSGTYDAAKVTSSDVNIGDTKIGTATVESLTSVRFSLDKANGMQFNEPAKFYYESDVNYYKDGALKTESMYSSVTVIPATSIYYEDNFLTFNNTKATVTDADGKEMTTGVGFWETVKDGSTTVAVQSTDRPGESLLSADYDADNIYGYDPAYANSTKYSLGTAQKVTVNKTTGGYATAPTVNFTFTGTGFDVISLTDNTSGAILVNVYTDSTKTTKEKSLIVNNYYGYTYDATNGWVVTDSADPNALYQIPVMKVDGLSSGSHYVEIMVAYMSSMDVTGDGQYSFWMDAVRIYNPLDTTSTNASVAQDAYAKDKENNPSYIKLRNIIVAANAFNSTTDTITGAVFIDGKGATNVSVADYANQGPNNEVYLTNGQGIAFQLQTNTDPETFKVHLGAKLAVGTSAKLKVGTSDFQTLKTATDMYYALENITWTKDSSGIYTSAPIVLSCSAEEGNILSLTNIKITSGASVMPVISSGAEAAVALAVDEPVIVASVDAATETYGLFTMRALYMIFEPEVFELTVDKSDVIVGDVVTATVTSSQDVAYVMIDGNVISEYTEAANTGYRLWSTSIKTEAVGEYVIEAVAHNEYDIACENTLTATISVEEKPIEEVIVETIKNSIKNLFDRITSFFKWF